MLGIGRVATPEGAQARRDHRLSSSQVDDRVSRTSSFTGTSLKARSPAPFGAQTELKTDVTVSKG